MNSFYSCNTCGTNIVNWTEEDFLDSYGSLCHCTVEANQQDNPTTDKKDTPTMENKKTALEAPTTSKTANERPQNNSAFKAYLLKNSDSTRHTFGTWSGVNLPRDKYFPVLMKTDAVAEIWNDNTGLVAINSDCVENMNAEAVKRREDELAQERRERQRAARLAEEKRLIKNITGMDLSRDDLVVFMTQARRDGEHFQPFLDALQALDDLDLERAGLTSWDEGLDEEGGF